MVAFLQICYMKRIGQHLIFWLVFWGWSSSIVDWHNIATNCDKSFSSNLMYMAKRLPLMITSTYLLVNWILPKYLFEKKAPAVFAALFALHFVITNLLDRTFVALGTTYHQWCTTTFWNSFFHYEAMFRNALMLIAVMGAACMIKFFKLFIQEEERNNQLAIENLQTKHAFLKAQVSPHFLFNALNNIYSMSVQNKQEKIANSLSNYVPLKNEIQLIEDFIHIQRLRLEETDDVIIAFNKEGNYLDKHIAPVILLPLVENTFKHGIRINRKCLVSIHLKILGDTLYFQTKNYHFTKPNQKGIEENGIGLINVQKRLSLKYQTNYQLNSSIKDQFYIVHLEVGLNSIP